MSAHGKLDKIQKSLSVDPRLLRPTRERQGVKRIKHLTVYNDYFSRQAFLSREPLTVHLPGSQQEGTRGNQNCVARNASRVLSSI
jgi:hypothetical protein